MRLRLNSYLYLEGPKESESMTGNTGPPRIVPPGSYSLIPGPTQRLRHGEVDVEVLPVDMPSSCADNFRGGRIEDRGRGTGY
jgi:hypothetical protein